MPFIITPNRWESDFFGRNIERVEIGSMVDDENTSTDISRATLQQIKVAAYEEEKITFLQQHGFQLVEGEVDFCLDVEPLLPPMTVGFIMPVEWSVLVATESDLPALQGLFANAFPNSRFCAPYFTPEENRRFYQEWITKAVRGEFDDVCLVQRATNGEIKGGITLRKCDNDMRVGLLAVAPKYRGCGVAKALLRSAYRWGQEYNAEKLYVATQTGNLAAIRLYGSVGAKICATNYWFYRVQK